MKKLEWIVFIKFCLVGLSNTFISYIINISILLFLNQYAVGWDYIAANVISFLLSVLWSFFWNNKFVFSLENGEKRVWWKTLIKTYISYGFTGIILNNCLSFIWINVFFVSKFIAPIINLVISVPINFFVNKKWAYK